MSLFEDLVDELKEDNLLEETIIDSVQKKDKERIAEPDFPAIIQNKASEPEKPDLNDKNVHFAKERVDKSEEIIIVEPESIEIIKNAEIKDADNQINQEFELTAEKPVEVTPAEKPVEVPPAEKPQIIEATVPEVFKKTEKSQVDGREFYRRRALDEVNGLEMVEHVLSGVEREQLKTVPKTYDDVKVKQALHAFLQVSEDIKSPKHAQAEFHLMQETEDWCSTLSRRDRNISVGGLRRYCESTKPSLSSQALISLARFYRNSPYSEDVRSKFDLVVTKLFSKDIIDEKRELVFNAEELTEHIQELYADWSSIPLYSTEEEDSDLLIAAIKFQDFMHEAESAESFDELVKRDFFKRLKVFKERTNENFFAPLIVSAAIESNVAVGNRYVDLLAFEREQADINNLTDKYGIIHDKAISEATSKTLELLEILKERKQTANSSNENLEGLDEESLWLLETGEGKYKKKGLFKANKWLVVATISTVIFAGVYFLSGGSKAILEDSKVSKDVKIVNLDNSSLKEYVHSARINENTLFAITNESWNKMTFAEKQEVIGKFLRTGEEKGFSKVHFLDSEGKSVAFATEGGINIVE